MTIHTDLFQRQAELEIEMQSRGALRYREMTEKALEKGRAANLAPGTHLIRQTVDPMKKALEEFLQESASGKMGRRMLSAKLIEGLDPAVVAYITAQVVMSYCVTSGPTKVAGQRNDGIHLSRLARVVASSIEDEARFDYFEAINPGLYQSLTKNLKERGTTEGHRRTVMVYTMGRYNIPWDRWSSNEKLNLGVKLLELFEVSTGLIEIRQVLTDAFGGRGKMSKKAYFVRLTDKVTQWFNEQLLKGELLKPLLLPTLIPPAVWPERLYGGGYHTEAVRPKFLVTGCSREHRSELSASKMPLVMRAVDALQNTRWQVNTDVLAVLREALSHNMEIADLAPSEDPQPPHRPLEVESDEEVRKKWRSEMRDHYSSLTRLKSARLRQNVLLETAGRFAAEDTIYYPHQLDFRGRFYPIPHGLQPQGNDLTKALLRFANPVPLGSEQAADWLAIHGANVWGEDKVSLEERIEWVEDNEDRIVRSAEDPLGYLWWTEADKPWCFLAFCLEWRQYLIEGLRFASRIPVALDGSCNGLQHFSAMLRDPIGGAAVNLVPSDRPQDIYQRVADRVMEKLREEAKADHEKAWMAEAWLQFGINRKVTKRPVMVLPYGGTFKSCMQYVREAVKERFDAGEVNPFGDDWKLAVGYLAPLVWSSIGDVVVAAKAAMDWLQTAARVCTKAGYPLKWTTPSGFVAYQDYRDLKQRRVKTRLHGNLVYLVHTEETDKLDSRTNASSISPNFVHSLDASAMVFTINMMMDQGIDSFAMIHDSYGVHAAHTEALAQTLRQAFVQMYKRDVLQDFLEGLRTYIPEEVLVDLPPLPKTGSLDISSVLRSDFFFA